MGIKIADVSPEDKKQLAKMVRAVSRNVRLAVPHADSTWRMPAVVDPRRAMAAVAGFFEHHGKMTQEDPDENSGGEGRVKELEVWGKRM
jgi:hypothetical protein